VVAILTLLVLAVSSLAAYGVARRRRPPLPARALGVAAGRMLETLGVTLVFLAANVVLAIGFVLVARAVSTEFVSAYVANDVTLVIVSLIQGIVWRWWAREGGGSGVPVS
jgi:hypothetical protein